MDDLEHTHADPQAVLSHLDNFQLNVNDWVADTGLKAGITRSVELYRAAYAKDHY